ncbi:MAG: helix-turn-helix transcriptional regulator [Eubacteriales bacterium]|nr:helix-turn-helix transcriptional regulator [Eubacteriales bacterium]
MILADKIIEERKKNGWSQEELAEQLGVSRQSVSKWESAGSVPDLKKILQLAELFGVSTDYLLKDDILPENETPALYNDTAAEEPIRKISMEEANTFLQLKAREAVSIANGVMLCIISPVILIILAALSEAEKYSLSENFAAGIGCTFMFVMIAAAVFMFITSSMKSRDADTLQKEVFETEYGVTGMVNEKKRAFAGNFTYGIAIGVVLCIVAVIPIFIAQAMQVPDHIAAILVGVLLLLVAIGVNMIIRVCIINGSFDTLLQEGEYSQKEKQFRQKTDVLSGIYWSIMTAIYLGWSFWTMRWDITWIIWPVAGVLFAAIAGIMRLFVKDIKQ